MIFLSTLFVFFLLGSENVNHPDTEQVTVKKEVLKKIGSHYLSEHALKKALDFYFKNKKKLGLSDRYMAIADFSKSSKNKRLAIINLEDKTTDFYKVSHGKGSDPNHDLIMDEFLNRPGSYGTPAGFHKMTTTYLGQHGLSLKMQGLEESNKNSEARAIVLHGADYVSWEHTGRSQGCPAVEKKWTSLIIDQLKGGSLFYFYKDN